MATASNQLEGRYGRRPHVPKKQNGNQKVTDDQAPLLFFFFVVERPSVSGGRKYAAEPKRTEVIRRVPGVHSFSSSSVLGHRLTDFFFVNGLKRPAALLPISTLIISYVQLALDFIS